MSVHYAQPNAPINKEFFKAGTQIAMGDLCTYTTPSQGGKRFAKRLSRNGEWVAVYEKEGGVDAPLPQISIREAVARRIAAGAYPVYEAGLYIPNGFKQWYAFQSSQADGTRDELLAAWKAELLGYVATQNAA